MTRRMIVALAAAAGSAAVLLLGLHRESQAAPAPIRIGTASFTPKKLPSNGGTIQIKSVAITARAGVTIFTVRARARLAGSTGGGTSATLSSPLRGKWSGTLSVSGNSSSSKASVDILVEVDSSAGLFSKRVGRVQLDPQRGDSSQPPPPPPI